MSRQSTSEVRVSRAEKIGYGLGDSASNVVFQMLVMFQAFFYTDVFGLGAAAMGTMLLLVRSLDALTDPLMGAIADRTTTRWGKFRPYLLWLCLPFAIFAVAAFSTPDLGAAGKLVYAYVTFSLLMLVYTAINIPYCALGGVITGDSQQRIALQSYRFVLATAAGVVVAATTMPLVDRLGQGDPRRGFQLAVAILGLLAIVMFLACFALTRERIVQASEKAGSFFEDLKILVANDQWMIIAALNFVLLAALVIRGASAIYYITWYAGREDLITAFLTTGMIASMIGAGFASPLTRRLSKVKSYVLIQLLIAGFSGAMYFLGAGQIALIFVFFFAIQCFVQMGSPILWTMMADTVDYGELKTERRITGLLFAGSLFSLKLGMAVGGAALGWLLAWFGYQGDAASQQPETASGIVLIFTVVPAVGHLLVAGIVTRYKLDKKRCHEIRMELDRRQEMNAP